MSKTSEQIRSEIETAKIYIKNIKMDRVTHRRNRDIAERGISDSTRRIARIERGLLKLKDSLPRVAARERAAKKRLKEAEKKAARVGKKATKASKRLKT